MLKLNEFDPETRQYTGNWMHRKVHYVLTKHPGLAEGYVLMGLLPA